MIALEVRDSEKFLANIAYTCQHLYPRPKLLILNYPHNPSTVTVEPEFFVEVVRLAKRYGFMVISDFAYADVAFDGYRPPSFLAAPGAIDVGVEFTTMSKGYNMAGWRVGYCCGNAEMIRGLGVIKGYYDYGMFQAIQIAAIVALRHTEAAVEVQSQKYQSRRDVLVEGLRRIGWTVEPPKAGMFVWAKSPRSVVQGNEHHGLCHDAAGGRGRGGQSGKRFWPSRRGLRAHGTGGKREPTAASGAPDRPLSAGRSAASMACGKSRRTRWLNARQPRGVLSGLQRLRYNPSERRSEQRVLLAADRHLCSQAIPESACASALQEESREKKEGSCSPQQEPSDFRLPGYWK